MQSMFKINIIIVYKSLFLKSSFFPGLLYGWVIEFNECDDLKYNMLTNEKKT